MNQNSFNSVSSKKLKIIAVILAVLLGLSLVFLSARIIYVNFFEKETASVVAPNNNIGEEHSAEQTQNDDAQANLSTSQQDIHISLYKGKPNSNERFEAKNMLPGDIETKNYSVEVSHKKDVYLYFDIDVLSQIKQLSEALNVRVINTSIQKELFNGSFSEIKEYSILLKANEEGKSISDYKIEVSLPTKTGNEYQAAELIADFNWYVKDKDALSPITGQSFDILLCVVLSASVIALAFIIVAYNKKKEVATDE